MKNIVVLVSGGGTNLQAVIDAIESGRIKNGRISRVISSKPGVFALERAEKAGIESLVLPRKDYSSNAEYTAKLVETLKSCEADLIVLAGFMVILGDEIFDEYENRIINIHPSLIPSFCGDGYYGLRVHEEALAKGVKVTGATVHFVNKITDGGPIILQKAVEVKEGDTPETLQQRVMEEAEWKIMPQAIDLFCNDRLRVTDNKVTVI